jgi:hypothetical protein
VLTGRRSLYTTAALQSRVVAGILAGKSRSELHGETRLSRQTIWPILSQSEVQALLASYQDQVRDLVALAINVVRRRLTTGRGTGWLAIEILKGTQALVGRKQHQVQHSSGELDSISDSQLVAFIEAGYERVCGQAISEMTP